MEGVVVFLDGPLEGDARVYADVGEVVYQPVGDNHTGIISLHEYHVDVHSPIADTIDALDDDNEPHRLAVFEAKQHSMTIIHYYPVRGRDGKPFWSEIEFGPGRVELKKIEREHRLPLDQAHLAEFMTKFNALMDEYGVTFYNGSYAEDNAEFSYGYAREEIE